MKLSVWTYEGPPHVGAMRVATGMTGLHYVLHAPQGDTYADLLFTMIERRDHRPPVTYTTFRPAIWARTRRTCSRPPAGGL
jgi:light-independent protochlorophyllide reductase subunit B